MTIASQTRTAGPFLGTGSIVAYPFAFKVFSAADLLVQQIDTSGNVTQWTLGGNYTVVLNADQSVSPGGTITPIAALPANYTLQVTSAVAATQPASLTNAGGFFPKTIEDALDRATILNQQSAVAMGSSLRVPELGGISPFPAAAQRAGLLMGWDGTGQPAAVSGPIAASPVVATAKRELQTATASQTVFTLATMAYASATPGSLLVIVNGAVQATTAYTQTSPTVVTFASGVALNAKVEFIAGNFTSLSSGSFAAAHTVSSNSLFGPSYEFRRNAEYTGGNPTKVNSAVRAVTYVDNPGATSLEWAFLAELHNSATGGQNVAIYGQGTKNAGAGPTWGGVFEGIDLSGGNPTTGCLGMEVDVRGDNADASSNRIGIDIVATRTSGSVASSMTAGYGVRFQTNNDSTCSYGTLIGTAVNVHANLGIDLSGAIIVGAALKLANTQAIQFDTSVLESNTDNGLDHNYGGVLQNRLLKTGGLQVHSVKVVGDRQTGWALPTGTLTRTTFDQSTVTLPQLAQRLAALITDLFGSGSGHGLIGV